MKQSTSRILALTGALAVASVFAFSCQNPIQTVRESASQRAVVGIPAKIEAEAYSQMSGIQTESCSEGGLNVGWFDKGDWMVYPISVPAAGTYTVQARVASPNGATLSFDYAAGSVQLGTVAIPATGGWQAWTTVSRTLSLPAGGVNLGLNTPTGGLNVNWIQISSATPTPTPSASPSEFFTIVAVPDTQFYVANVNGGRPETFDRQTRWIVDNAQALNVKLVTHLGDITDSGFWNEAQYVHARRAWDTVANSALTWDILPGNHEGYGPGWVYNSANLSKYNQYFPESYLSSKPFYGGSYPAGTLNNSYVLFSAGGVDFLNISIGCLGFNGATLDKASRDWVNRILDRYPNRKAILSTHDYMSEAGLDPCGVDLWNECITTHENVFMVLCGHHKRESLRQTNNNFGKPVYQMLSDYQGDPNGGNGWLRYLKFYPGQRKIEVYTYSPTLNAFENDANSRFDLAYNF